jgi:hypothetical protein
MRSIYILMRMTTSFILASFNLLKGDQSDQLAAYRRISDCYDETHDWMTTNKLKMNGDKTELLLVLPSSRRGKASSWKPFGSAATKLLRRNV